MPIGLQGITGGGGGGLTGSGTANFGTKWTGATTLGNSLYRDDGTFTSIGVAPVSTQRLTVVSTTATSATFIAKFHGLGGTNNALVLRGDGFSSMGSLPVTNTRLNIQGSSSAPATFALKLDNSTPGNAIAYFSNNRAVSIATSTFNPLTTLTIDGRGDLGIFLTNCESGIDLTSSVAGGTGILMNMSGDNATALSLISTGAVGIALSLSAGNGTLITASSSGVLDSNLIAPTVYIQRDFDLNGFDTAFSLVTINDASFNGTSTGDILSVQKLSANVFSINNTGQTTFKASDTASSSINIAAGTAPTSPNDGDMWYDGTNVKFRVGGLTKTFTLI